MKRYWKVKNSANEYTGDTFVQVFLKTDEQHCTLCSAMKQELSSTLGLSNRLKGLCRKNLRAHLATGKHWKVVNIYYIKTRKV